MIKLYLLLYVAKAIILNGMGDNDGKYTKRILLEAITERQFDSYKPPWNAEEWDNRDTILCEITQTIVGTNYEGLLRFLLNHEYADEISVRVRDKEWMGEYTRRVSNSMIACMAKEAATSRWMDNYFEIKFKELRFEKEDRPRAVIKFSEIDGLIIATRVIIPPMLTQLFTIANIDNHDPGKYYYGVLGKTTYEQIVAQKNHGILEDGVYTQMITPKRDLV